MRQQVGSIHTPAAASVLVILVVNVLGCCQLCGGRCWFQCSLEPRGLVALSAARRMLQTAVQGAPDCSVDCFL
jgi:hypothetical protein